MAFISNWLTTGDYAAGHPSVDYDYVPGAGAACRYRTITYSTAGNFDIMTCATYENAGTPASTAPFENSGPKLIYEKIVSYCNHAADAPAPYGTPYVYTFGVNPDGSFLTGNHTPYTGDYLMSPLQMLQTGRFSPESR